MIVTGPALIVAVRAHGEHGAIVRALTPEHGLQAGYVRGGRSRRLRPVLLPGNLVEAEFRARVEEQLAAATVELAHSRAPLLSEPLPAAGIEWVTALVAAALPEGQPYSALYEGLSGVLDAIEHAPSARGWALALARFEQLLLLHLGFGGASGTEATVRDMLRVNGAALQEHLFVDRRVDVMAARERLVERLKRSFPASRA
ncbi:MAG TPA: recombination protein O N-terminal domain-containing protein [Sphingomonas sp.]|nr:recombination protein O N-terminal domain-containing protein [Sphingomonas sp.]